MKKGVRVLAVMGLAMVLSGCVQSRQAHTESAAAFDEPQYDWGSISGEKLVIWGIYPEMERSYITKAFDRYQELDVYKRQFQYPERECQYQDRRFRQ